MIGENMMGRGFKLYLYAQGDRSGLWKPKKKKNKWEDKDKH